MAALAVDRTDAMRQLPIVAGAGLGHVALKHPQYQKRFLNKERAAYVARLKGALNGAV